MNISDNINSIISLNTGNLRVTVHHSLINAYKLSIASGKDTSEYTN